MLELYVIDQCVAEMGHCIDSKPIGPRVLAKLFVFFFALLTITVNHYLITNKFCPHVCFHLWVEQPVDQEAGRLWWNSLRGCMRAPHHPICSYLFDSHRGLGLALRVNRLVVFCMLNLKCNRDWYKAANRHR